MRLPPINQSKAHAAGNGKKTLNQENQSLNGSDFECSSEAMDETGTISSSYPEYVPPLPSRSHLIFILLLLPLYRKSIRRRTGESWLI